jgi:hypothetical protein
MRPNEVSATPRREASVSISGISAKPDATSGAEAIEKFQFATA